ncbi:membrane protein implicated in regulation of membrane protease activity [Microbacterium sp. SORGH_AS428]|uniref:hypothetical protein n=1 Tax=Microbacterium sp. SORGH_AS_0428 TaxID=3041788 RepID=UPI00285ADF3A|nr:hypothetical protein [Microbacterium sp. SORGH_AS_0428]MDR6198632.1 membrane protein implicated in regulation of membrane protease activity [Microbacterium sp. SORGH_AS_0428]
MGFSDPHYPLGPYGRIGSVVNVAMSAIFGAVAIAVGFVTGQGGAFAAGLGLWAMCVFAFVPVMRRALKYERERRHESSRPSPD